MYSIKRLLLYLFFFKNRKLQFQIEHLNKNHAA